MKTCFSSILVACVSAIIAGVLADLGRTNTAVAFSFVTCVACIVALMSYLNRR